MKSTTVISRQGLFRNSATWVLPKPGRLRILLSPTSSLYPDLNSRWSFSHLHLEAHPTPPRSRTCAGLSRQSRAALGCAERARLPGHRASPRSNSPSKNHFCHPFLTYYVSEESLLSIMTVPTGENLASMVRRAWLGRG